MKITYQEAKLMSKNPGEIFYPAGPLFRDHSIWRFGVSVQHAGVLVAEITKGVSYIEMSFAVPTGELGLDRTYYPLPSIEAGVSDFMGKVCLYWGEHIRFALPYLDEMIG